MAARCVLIKSGGGSAGLQPQTLMAITTIAAKAWNFDLIIASSLKFRLNQIVSDCASSIKKAAPAHRSSFDRMAGRNRKSVLRLVDHFVLGNPRHHRAQLAAHFLDLMLG